MPENKFDLNKALQAAKLYNKIDYGNLYIPDVQQTMDNFENWRKSQGYKTEEEKQEDLKAEMQAAQQRFNDRDLWNSEDPYEVYNAYQTDPEKQEEFRRNGETTAGILSTVATLPFTAGMTGGWIPAITTTATGAAGGYAGAYGGQQLGQYLDNKYGTNTTPYLSTIGGLAGGILGGGLGYKGWEGATNQYLINKAFKSGQLKYGQPTAYTAYHQSSTPITKFKFPFKERWDVRTHGADPNGAFFTVGEPAAAGFLAERPYTGQFQVKVQKPLIQTGELTGPTKNGLRNAIVRRARKNGADAVFFDGIADNQLKNQQILFATDNADIGYRGMVSTPFKQGNWQSPKSIRNQVLNGHLKGDDAVQMFKDYGVVSIPANSKIYSNIQKLVPEARERYGLVGHTGVTDDEIAGSLYKRAMDLNGEGNAAVWTETGEPKLLFRGDTRRYNRLWDRPEPEHLLSGTEDNSLGNLFLGELPGGSEQGIERYLHRVVPSNYFRGDTLWLSSTGKHGIKHGKTVLQEIPNELRAIYGKIYGPKASRSFGKVKLLPANLSAGGGNDINPFVIRAKNIRDASDEISVGANVRLLESKGIDYSSGARDAMLKHYRTVLDDAASKNQGLLISNPNSLFRPDEHALNTYYALPNFNRQNAKHLFGWDLRRPVQWDVDNIYLEKGGKIENPDH